MSIVEQAKSRRSAVTKDLLNCPRCAAVVALCLGAMINGAAAGSFTLSCAARDLQIPKLIEERENTGAISAERLSDTMVTMMNARTMCYGGQVVDALAMYDRVAGSLGFNNWSQRASPDLTICVTT